MTEIKIKDIEMLHKKNQDILELERKIQELHEIKELKKLQQEEIELKNKIKIFSTYDSVLIGNVVVKLMTSFEGIEYCCSKNDICFLNCDYRIEPKSNNRDNMYIYPSYKIKNIKQERLFFDTSDKKEMCYLPPSSFKSNASSRYNSRNKDTEYIQLFIDYLYERRSSKSLEKISNIELEEVLKEFLEITNDLQHQRKTEIIEKIEARIKQQKRKEFEESCVIDRKLIFNSLAYIINHYEDNISAIQEKEKEWSRNWQWSELTGYHKLTIKSEDKEVCFKAEVDSQGCYPDEEYCGVYIDINKDTNVCFFDVKRKLTPILKNSNYAINFINMIENLYNEGEDITSDKVREFLVLLSNESKGKQRILKI